LSLIGKRLEVVCINNRKVGSNLLIVLLSSYSGGDWAAAERLLLQETFTRGMGCSLSLVSALKVRGPSFLLHTAFVSLPEVGAAHESCDGLVPTRCCDVLRYACN
jgi:hypothetical protein